jgi:hypothetical protein
VGDSGIVAFYEGRGRDHRGRLLSDIRKFGFHELEGHHDYIQWLFPLPEPSGANPSAPLLTAEDIAAFERDEGLRDELRRSFQQMLVFFGLEESSRGPGTEVMTGSSFDVRRREWLTPGNHNFLRISRMLRSLSLLGLPGHARAFLACLERIYAEHAEVVGTTTLGYWRNRGTTKTRNHEDTKARRH